MKASTEAAIGVGAVVGIVAVMVGGIAWAAHVSKTSAPSGGGVLPPAGGGTPSPQTSPGTPPASPVTPTASGTSVWVASTTVHPGDQVRMAVLPADAVQLAQSFATMIAQNTATPSMLALQTAITQLNQQWAPQTPTEQAGMTTFLQVGPVGDVLKPDASLVVYPQGDVLPADWPTDDVNAPNEIHAQFSYSGTVPLDVSGPVGGLPVRVWVLHKVGG